MVKTPGMFGEMIDDTRADDKMEDDRLRQMATMGGINESKYASLAGARMAGEALGSMGVRAMGGDPRTGQERLQSAMKAIGDMQQTQDLSTPEGTDAYYRSAIKILGEHGLAGEAHAAAKEWNDYKNKSADRQVKLDEVARKVADDKRKAGIADEANRIRAERNKQLAVQGLPEFVQVVNGIENATDPVTRKRLLDYANAKVESLQKGIAFEDAGDRVIVRNKATGAILGTDMAGDKPMNEKDRLKRDDKVKALFPAYQSAMLGMQTDYKAAADLYNNPGLDELIGKWTGLAAQYGTTKDGMLSEGAIAALSPAGRDALALFQQIQGGAFVRALSDLKIAGGGSTGLGAVSDTEGGKVTAAKAALFPRQQPASFRRHLGDYISVLEQSAEILGGKAQSDNLDPIHLNVVELTGPVRGGAAPAPTAPRPGTPRNPANSDSMKVRRKSDGQPGRIPRSQFNPNLYEEIK